MALALGELGDFGSLITSGETDGSVEEGKANTWSGEAVCEVRVSVCLVFVCG